MELDMTKGSPFKLIVRFLLPIVAGNFIQQLYNLADSVIVGRCISGDALAAVGATGTIMFLIIGFMNGMTSGFAVVTAQRFGARDEEGVRYSVCSAIVLSGVIAIVMTALSLFFMRDLLKLMNTPDNVFEMSYTYIFTICAGLVFTVLYNLTASLLRAVGNSRIPLVFLAIAAGINVILDLLFIVYFDMGVFGAALATITAQGFSGIACLLYIFFRVPTLSPKRSDWAHWRDHAKLQFTIGIPMALQFTVTALGTVIVQSALNTFGSVVMAAHTAAGKVEQLVIMPFQGMGAAMATYAGQNRGVNDYRRIRKGATEAALLSSGYAIFIAAVIMLTPQYTIPLFVTEDPTELIQWAKVYFSICPPFYIPLGLIFVYRNSLQGMGCSLMTVAGAAVELVSRIICARIAVSMNSFRGVCFANSVAWTSAGLLLLISFEIIVRKKISESKPENGL